MLTPHFRSSAALRRGAETIFKQAFEHSREAALILTPDLNIAAVNQAYSRAVERGAEDLVGQHMFDAFPENPDDPSDDGATKLMVSLERLLSGRPRDVMGTQRYDVRDSSGIFRVRHWEPINWRTEDGGRVVALVHSVREKFPRGEAGIDKGASQIRNLIGDLALTGERTRELVSKQGQIFDEILTLRANLGSYHRQKRDASEG